MPQVVYPRQVIIWAFPNLLHGHCITNIWRRKQIIPAFIRECEFCILYTTESWLTRLHSTHHLISFNRHHRTLATLRKLTNSVAQEPEGSSPHSQQPATGPCSEPVESNPPPPQANLRKINSDPIFPPTPWSSQWSLSFGFSHQNLVHLAETRNIFIATLSRLESPSTRKLFSFRRFVYDSKPLVTHWRRCYVTVYPETCFMGTGLIVYLIAPFQLRGARDVEKRTLLEF
jgi:hypothetical protein